MDYPDLLLNLLSLFTQGRDHLCQPPHPLISHARAPIAHGSIPHLCTLFFFLPFCLIRAASMEAERRLQARTATAEDEAVSLRGHRRRRHIPPAPHSHCAGPSPGAAGSPPNIVAPPQLGRGVQRQADASGALRRILVHMASRTDAVRCSCRARRSSHSSLGRMI